MAILQMKRLTLAVIRDQKDALFNDLVRNGCVEVSEIGEEIRSSEIADLVKSENTELMSLKQAHASLIHALELLNRYVPKKSPLLAAKPEVDADTLLDETGMWGAVKFARQIEEDDASIKRISAEESRQRSVIESLKPWEELTMPLNCEGTGYASVQLGTIPARISVEDVNQAIAGVTDECELFVISTDRTQHYCMRYASVESFPRCWMFCVRSGLFPLPSAAWKAPQENALAKPRFLCRNSLRKRSG